MSLASQHLAEIRTAREDRERVENETANEVRFQLALHTWPHHFDVQEVKFALLVANRNGSSFVTNQSGEQVAVIAFFEGKYDVAVYDNSQEG